MDYVRCTANDTRSCQGAQALVAATQREHCLGYTTLRVEQQGTPTAGTCGLSVTRQHVTRERLDTHSVASARPSGRRARAGATLHNIPCHRDVCRRRWTHRARPAVCASPWVDVRAAARARASLGRAQVRAVCSTRSGPVALAGDVAPAQRDHSGSRLLQLSATAAAWGTWSGMWGGAGAASEHDRRSAARRRPLRNEAAHIAGARPERVRPLPWRAWRWRALRAMNAAPRTARRPRPRVTHPPRGEPAKRTAAPFRAPRGTAHFAVQPGPIPSCVSRARCLQHVLGSQRGAAVAASMPREASGQEHEPDGALPLEIDELDRVFVVRYTGEVFRDYECDALNT